MRELILGNTNLILSYDMKMNIRDLYFPRIGDENHLESNKNRIGFWVNGKFSWIDEEWNMKTNYKKDSLVSEIFAETDYLGIKITENACVHYKKNIYLKVMKITNTSESVIKDIRIFFHHMLKLYGETKNSTAIYDPITNSLIHYKKNRYFLFNGASPDTDIIYEYNIDTMDIGSEGNYKDAEDGKLEMNKVGQGRINSMISLRGMINPGETKNYYYWFCAGKNFEDVRELNSYIIDNGVEGLIDETQTYWKNWTNKRILNFGKTHETLIELYKKSLIIIKSHINENGSVISSINYEHLQFYRDNYNYTWPRDASITAIALDGAGYTEIGRNIFRQLNTLITASGYFWGKYYADGAMASIWHPWIGKDGVQLPIQEDQTAFVLIALYNHYKISMDIEFIDEVFENLVKKLTNFLADFINEKNGLPMESYDFWDIKKGTHLLTSAAVYEALMCSKEFLNIFGENKLVERIDKVCEILINSIKKYFYDDEEKIMVTSIKRDECGKYDTIVKYDASILFAANFDKFYEALPEIEYTIEKNLEKLWIKTDIGGCSRFENDSYHQLTRDIKNIPGNPWVTLTLMSANFYIKTGKLELAEKILKNISEKIIPSGLMPEQMHPYTGEGVSVTPYILSHACYITTINNYLKKKNVKII